MEKVLLLVASLLLVAVPAQAQRGTGEAEGLARQGARPEMIAISGTIADLQINPCEMTTGRSIVGAHVLVNDPARGPLNIHLGPATDVADLVSHLQKGDALQAVVFRTSRLPEGQFIARDLNVDGEQFVLRDESLRPVWAGTPQGDGAGRRGAQRGMRGPGGRRGWN